MAENTETNCLKNKGFFEKKYQQARLCKNSSIKQATQYSLKKKKKKERKEKNYTFTKIVNFPQFCSWKILIFTHSIYTVSILYPLTLTWQSQEQHSF